MRIKVKLVMYIIQEFVNVQLTGFHLEISVWDGSGHGSFMHHVLHLLLPLNSYYTKVLWILICDIQRVL